MFNINLILKVQKKPPIRKQDGLKKRQKGKEIYRITDILKVWGEDVVVGDGPLTCTLTSA
jgi:hypothetical protein